MGTGFTVPSRVTHRTNRTSLIGAWTVLPVTVFHPSTRPAQLFPHHPSQYSFQRFLRAPDVRAQRLVDQVLITSTARIIDLLAEPVQNIIIQPDRNARLAARNLDHRPPLAFREIVLLLHVLSSYCRRSSGVACL